MSNFLEMCNEVCRNQHMLQINAEKEKKKERDKVNRKNS